MRPTANTLELLEKMGYLKNGLKSFYDQLLVKKTENGLIGKNFNG